jgi:hypothetical protein
VDCQVAGVSTNQGLISGVLFKVAKHPLVMFCLDLTLAHVSEETIRMTLMWVGKQLVLKEGSKDSCNILQVLVNNMKDAAYQ